MKKIIMCFAFLTVSSLARAESEWNFDSCMENVMRQFTCSIKGQKVPVDLESPRTQLSYISVSEGKIYGLIVENVANGELYVSCDDSADLKNVLFFESNDVVHNVHCEAP